jgi:hypothetical protein
VHNNLSAVYTPVHGVQVHCAMHPFSGVMYVMYGG